MINRRTFVVGLAAASTSACSTKLPNPATMPDPEAPDALSRLRFSSSADARTWASHLHHASMLDMPNILALSGGGEDGAFGAGALNGWTVRGDRPAFDLVTGISTGALIAPFAFLGAAYDPFLRKIFTEHDAHDILRLRGLAGLLGNSIYDTSPLVELIENYTTSAVIEAVADRHASGGRLLMVTSNLDTAKAVIWNMGEVAQSGQYSLFRQIMRASSALPGLFPPVILQYSVGDEVWRETHIDGGVNMQLLAVPPAAVTSTHRSINGGHLYLLINNTLDPSPQAVSRSVIGISQQALTTMIRSSAAETVRSAQLFAQQSDLHLSVTSIDPDAGIVFDPSKRFDLSYMRQLFNHGYGRAVSGTLWH